MKLLPSEKYLIPAWAHAVTVPQVSPGTSLIMADSTFTPQRRPIVMPHCISRNSSSGRQRPVNSLPYSPSNSNCPLRMACDQPLLLFRRGLAQVGVHRPKHFGIPLEPGLGRIAGRLGAQIQRLVDVVPLPAHHVRLKVRVADVDVRMRQQVHDPFPRRLERRRTLDHRLAGIIDRHLQRSAWPRSREW